jgi:hypothetical protein
VPQYFRPDDEGQAAHADEHGGLLGSGMAYNIGRFATAVVVFAAGALFTACGGLYPAVGRTLDTLIARTSSASCRE